MAAKTDPDKKQQRKKPGPKAAKPEPEKKNSYGPLQVMGKPRRWPTEDALQADFIRYIEHCAEKQFLPNISGFCVFVDITKDTFYAQQQHYPDSYKKIRQALEDSLIQHERFGQKNPAMAIVQGKNTFRWDDTGKGSGDNSALLDVDFDANQDEIDTYLSKLGYFALPDPTE